MSKEDTAECLAYFDEHHDKFERFCEQVKVFFKTNSTLNSGRLPTIHSIKARVKDREHLKEKLERKGQGEEGITKENLFNRITDLAGVRVLHIYHQQFPKIHEQIIKHIEQEKEWVLAEKPIAYTWDPELESMYERLGFEPKFKESHYTSIHYVVRPNTASIVSCEIQVRTLFDEIWGEIDHTINYPTETKSLSCKEQIRVLAKLVNSGTRLADSIFRSQDEFEDLAN